jgi:uncharacterized membrane protein
MKYQTLTVEQLKSLRKPVRNVRIEQLESFSGWERLAVFVTEHIGTMGFFFIILFWTITWIGWNTFALSRLRFDPYPAFVLWLFLSNVLQMLLMPLLMIGQNLQGRHAEARAQADFEVNLKAEREVEAILQHLENQTALLL